MQTLSEMLAVTVRRHGRRTAIVDGQETLTYDQLMERVTACAHRLSCMGVVRGDRVALLLPNSGDFVHSYFAALQLGAIVVPLNANYQETELSHLLKTCGVSVLVARLSAVPLCLKVLSGNQLSCRMLVADDPGQADTREGAGFAETIVGPDSPVMYQFSSGSTGIPKRISRTHRQLLVELDNLVGTLGLSAQDRFLGVAPFSHVNGLVRTMLASMRAGAALYPVPRFNRQTVVETVQAHRLSVFIAVPFMFSTLAQGRFRHTPDFSSLRWTISASAPMPKKLNHEFQDRFGMYVRQLYGSTETGTISVDLSADIENSLESVGLPLAGIEVDIRREDGNPVEGDETGEIAVRSPTAILGYDGQDELNREVFREGFFFTGDLGRRDAAGRIYLTGRTKFLINKGGYKIDPHEIEAILEQHPDVQEAVVVGVPTLYGDEKVKAVLVAGSACSEHEVLEHCRGKIADFKVPSLIEFRDTLPRSATGKILRGRLTEAE